MRWLRLGTAAICGRLYFTVLLLMLLAWWASCGEVYAALASAFGRNEVAALVLDAGNLCFGVWLCASYLRLAQDLQQLRLPQRRQVLAGALTFIVGLLGVLPCTLLAALHWAAGDVLRVALVLPASFILARLWRVGLRTWPLLPHAAGAGAHPIPHPARAVSPLRALRVVLGAPYAPASWSVRVLQLLGLTATLVAPALLVVAAGRPLNRIVFKLLLHSAEFVGYFGAIGVCWIWPLARAVTLFNPARGAVSELALLPGLGAGRARLLQLCLVMIGWPALGLLALTLIALGAVWWEGLPQATYWRVLIQSALIPLVTLPLVLGQMARPRAPVTWSVAALMLSQTFCFALATWSVSWNILAIVSLRWLTIGVAAVVLSVMVGFSAHFYWILARRPHPFVEVSS